MKKQYYVKNKILIIIIKKQFSKQNLSGYLLSLIINPIYNSKESNKF